MATTRKPRTQKTSADLKAELELAKKKLEELERRAYAEELTELIAKSNIVNEFKEIQSKVKEANPVAIVAAIAHAVGIRRITISQAPVQKRAPSSKPRKKKAN